jgi:hypothetical protein
LEIASISIKQPVKDKPIKRKKVKKEQIQQSKIIVPNLPLKDSVNNSTSTYINVYGFDDVIGEFKNDTEPIKNNLDCELDIVTTDNLNLPIKKEFETPIDMKTMKIINEFAISSKKYDQTTLKLQNPLLDNCFSELDKENCIEYGLKLKLKVLHMMELFNSFHDQMGIFYIKI